MIKNRFTTNANNRRIDPEADRPTLPPTLDPALARFEETTHASGEWHAVLGHVTDHLKGTP